MTREIVSWSECFLDMSFNGGVQFPALHDPQVLRWNLNVTKYGPKTVSLSWCRFVEDLTHWWRPALHLWDHKFHFASKKELPVWSMVYFSEKLNSGWKDSIYSTCFVYCWLWFTRYHMTQQKGLRFLEYPSKLKNKTQGAGRWRCR